MTAGEFSLACINILNPIIKSKFSDLIVEYISDVSFPESFAGTLDSTNLQPTDWCLLADFILSRYMEFDGWILLHGTDTMDFTGAALPLLLSGFDRNGIAWAVLSKPVIITGSQVPMFYRKDNLTSLTLNYNTDAYQNFCGAVASAQTGIPEVCVYFQNHLYRANRILKTNASEFSAFSSPNYPALAEYGINFRLHAENILPGPVSYQVSLDNPQVLKRVRKQLSYVHAHVNAYPVMQFNAFPAAYSNQQKSAFVARLIDACVGQGIKGLILEAYGEGNFPSGNPDTPCQGAIYKALAAADNKGIVIVDCTQVISGLVDYSAYAAGAWLSSVGALSSADMTSVAAFAKLMILLVLAACNHWSRETVKYLVRLNLQGEMMNVNRLDSRGNCELLPGQSISALDGSALLTNDPLLGPVLTAIGGKKLWSAFSSPPQDMPGCLTMQNDGNLVYYSRFNAPLWAAQPDAGIKKAAPSQLILMGSITTENLVLQVYNYAENIVSVTLYRHS